MKIIDCVQGSEEWHRMRRLTMGASNAQAIAAKGKGLETFVRELVRNYLSSNPDQGYSNQNMENGIEMEATAAMLYEFETGNKTELAGYVVYSEHVGCSPDRFVGEDGLIEIKCPTDKVFFDFLVDRKVDTKYDWQMQMQMLVCDRKWCDYVVYNPNFEKQLVIIRQLPDNKKFDKLLEGFEVGIKRIKELLSMDVLRQG